MAFTEAQLIAQIDSTGTGRVVVVEDFIVGETVTDLYCVGVIAPYAGRSRFVQVPNTNTAAQTWTAIQAELA